MKSRISLYLTMLGACTCGLFRADAAISVDLLYVPQQIVAGSPIEAFIVLSESEENIERVALEGRRTDPLDAWVEVGSTPNGFVFPDVQQQYEINLTWTPEWVLNSNNTANPSQLGEREFRVKIFKDDGSVVSGGSVWGDIVSPAPRPISLSLPSVAVKGVEYEVLVSAVDPDGNLKEILLYENAPDGPTTGNPWTSVGSPVSVSGYSASAKISWTPNVSGEYQFHFGIWDHDGNKHDSHEEGPAYTFKVLEVPQVSSESPEFDFVNARLLDDNGTYYFSFECVDSNGDLSHVSVEERYYPMPSNGEIISIEDSIPLAGERDGSGFFWSKTYSYSTLVMRVYDFEGNFSEWSAVYYPSYVTAFPEVVMPRIVRGGLVISANEEFNVVHESYVGTAGEVVFESGSGGVFWSGGAVILGPGFKASYGSEFAAVIDSDMDGRSDREENTDSDNDGMLDGYEYEIIDSDFFDTITSLDHVVPTDDFDMDGVSNGSEALAGTSPAGYEVGQTSNYKNVVVMLNPISGHKIVDMNSLLVQSDE